MNKKPAMKTDTIDREALMSARWQAYRQTWRILHDPALSDAEKFEQCDSVCALHAAVWADLSIYPVTHPVRLYREELLSELPATLKIARATRKERDGGMIGML